MLKSLVLCHVLCDEWTITILLDTIWKRPNLGSILLWLHNSTNTGRCFVRTIWFKSCVDISHNDDVSALYLDAYCLWIQLWSYDRSKSFARVIIWCYFSVIASHYQKVGLIVEVYWDFQKVIFNDRWAYKSELTTFIAVANVGGMFGTAVAFPICGLILDRYGWQVRITISFLHWTQLFSSNSFTG